MKHAFRLSTFNYVNWILPRSKAQATEPTSPRKSRSETVKTWALALVCCLEQNFDLLVNHLISWKEQKRTLRSPSHKHMPVVFFRHQNVQAGTNSWSYTLASVPASWKEHLPSCPDRNFADMQKDFLLRQTCFSFPEMWLGILPWEADCMHLLYIKSKANNPTWSAPFKTLFKHSLCSEDCILAMGGIPTSQHSIQTITKEAHANHWYRKITWLLACSVTHFEAAKLMLVFGQTFL